MTLNRAINWVVYHGLTKPTENISDNRWNAMLKYIYREYPDVRPYFLESRW